MKIAVCFKVAPDLEKVVDADWQVYTPEMDLRYAGWALNCFDESALEMALRLKEACTATGSACSCTAITLGEGPPPSLWQTLYATGYEEIRVLTSEQGEFAPVQLAAALAPHLKDFDVILTGRQAPMGDTASVPYLLAEHLGIPVIPEVEELSFRSETSLSVECSADEGRLRLEVRLPVILAVGNSPVSALRAATLRSKLQAAKRNVESAPIKLPEQAPPILIRETTSKKCVFWAEDEPALLAAKLKCYMEEGGGA